MNLRWLRPAALALLLLSPAHAQNLNTGPLLVLQGAGAGTLVSPDLTNPTFRGVIVGVSLTSVTSATVVAHIQGRDIASGTYYDLLVGTASTTTGFEELVVYPGVTVAAGASPSSPLPTTWRIEVVERVIVRRFAPSDRVS